MKIHKFLSLSLVMVLSLSMIGITTSSASSPFFLNGSSAELNYTTPDLMIEAVDSNALTTQSTLPTVEGYWTDLVDTEQVSNDGSGVYVAVLDTGLLPNWESLFSQATIRDDLGIGFSHDITYDPATGLNIGPVKQVGFETDLASGHGTHVTSTIVGFNVADSMWVNGVAPNAQIIPVRVLDAWDVPTPDGESLQLSGGTDPMIASGIYYIAQLAGQLDGPVVINMSLGGPNPQPIILDAIRYAISQGVIVVASAGNSGSAGMGYPGAYSEVISTAAAGWTETWYQGWTADAPEQPALSQTDAFGNSGHLYLEDFSSRPNHDLGQKHQDLDVAAPGAWIVGPYKSAFANNFNYYYLSGTSMSAPHVAGMAALVLQSHPDLNQGQMENILRLAGQGNPLPADDAMVFFPYVEGLFYSASWDGGDYGTGFLTAPNALSTAAIFA